MKYLIKEIGIVITGTTPSTKNKLNYNSNDYMFITPGDLKSQRYLKTSINHISNVAYNTEQTRHLNCNDIVIDCIGADMGNVGVITKECISNQQINAITNINDNIVLSLYLYYLLSTKKKYLHTIGNNGATMPIINKSMFENIELSIDDLTTQQHIVDTIGSVDDLIEKNEEIIDKIKTYGNNLFSTIDTSQCVDANSFISFEKGIEIGSANYYDKEIENSTPYIRVGNLLNNNYDTYCIDNDYKKCNYDDILIAFDGAPGRNSIGLKGVYSSGIYKVKCEEKNKGFIYFYINSKMCQNIIKENSQGTTILHASKSIKLLQLPKINDLSLMEKFSNIYRHLIMYYKQQIILKQLKQTLLSKYFD